MWTLSRKGLTNCQIGQARQKLGQSFEVCVLYLEIYVADLLQFVLRWRSPDTRGLFMEPVALNLQPLEKLFCAFIHHPMRLLICFRSSPDLPRKSQLAHDALLKYLRPLLRLLL